LETSEIEVFENSMRTRSSRCYKDISNSVLASLEACFLAERIFNWKIQRKDFGNARRDLAGF
jgi:hypothetical protein